MPRYFFDCFDGHGFRVDSYGVEIAAPDDVAEHGAALAQELLGEGADGTGTRAVSVMVRSEEGAQVYAAHCTFHGMVLSGRDRTGSI